MLGTSASDPKQTSRSVRLTSLRGLITRLLETFAGGWSRRVTTEDELDDALACARASNQVDRLDTSETPSVRVVLDLPSIPCDLPAIDLAGAPSDSQRRNSLTRAVGPPKVSARVLMPVVEPRRYVQGG